MDIDKNKHDESSLGEPFVKRLESFYVKQLNLKKVSEQQKDKDLKYEDVLDRIKQGKESYGIGEGSSQEDFDGDEDDESDEDTMIGNQKAMIDLIDRKNLQMQQVVIDWDNIVTVMNNELPQIPAPPEVEEINPPDQEMLRVVIGKLKPIDKNAIDKKKKQAKKAQPKKGDEKPKVIKWSDGPPKYIKTTYQHINEANQ